MLRQIVATMVQRLFGRAPRPPRPTLSREELARLDAMLADTAWMEPPANLRDADGWNAYYKAHIEHGLGPELMDMLAGIDRLIPVLQRVGVRTVLCAGNGMSLEPRALAAAGFDVKVVDLAGFGLAVARDLPFPPERVRRYCGAGALRDGGQVQFGLGDLLDPDVLPGPFDVVIERRTAQLYARDGNEALDQMMESLIRRLGPEGILVTHCHDGGWRPPNPPRHATRTWLEEHGWRVWQGEGEKPSGQVAWPVLSTG